MNPEIYKKFIKNQEKEIIKNVTLEELGMVNNFKDLEKMGFTVSEMAKLGEELTGNLSPAIANMSGLEKSFKEQMSPAISEMAKLGKELTGNLSPAIANMGGLEKSFKEQMSPAISEMAKLGKELTGKLNPVIANMSGLGNSFKDIMGPAVSKKIRIEKELINSIIPAVAQINRDIQNLESYNVEKSNSKLMMLYYKQVILEKLLYLYNMLLNMYNKIADFELEFVIGELIRIVITLTIIINFTINMPINIENINVNFDINIENVHIGQKVTKKYMGNSINKKIVVVKSLIVRKEPNKNSTEIKKLNFKEPIYILKRKENWLNIMFSVKDNKYKRGWVKEDGIGKINIE